MDQQLEAELRTTREVAGMICAVLVVMFILGCMTYGCTRPSEVDREQQAVRVLENNQMVSCVRAGGSWMPVRKAKESYDTTMACITPTTLELATKMNTGG